MLTPSQQLAAVFSGLSDDQKIEAVGTYSKVGTSTPDDITRLVSYFNPNVTSYTSPGRSS
jgi:hypothetical protein